MRKHLGFIFSGLAACVTLLEADLVDGLIAYYPMDESSGTQLIEQVNGSVGSFGEFVPTVAGPDWATNAPYITLDSAQQEFVGDLSSGNGIEDAITLSAWIKPSQFADWLGIITKGTIQAPYSLTLWNNGALNFGVNDFNPPGGSGAANFVSTLVMDTARSDVWYHVAVTYDGANVRFYIDGVKDSSEPSAAITFGTVEYGLTIGVDYPGVPQYFSGSIREVMIYDRALSDIEIQSIYAGAKPGLAKLDTSYTGLWVGQAQLSEVKELSSDTWASAPSGFSEQIILHVNDAGTARLLAQATIMQTRVTAPATPEQVVISDTDLIPNYDGITPRGGKLVGQRFSSATIPMAGDSVLLTQSGETLSADLSLAPADPLNPFRHKYHPDLKNGYDIGRTLSFTVPAADSPVDNEFTGTFTETVSGLHKDDIEARGSVTFIRVSTSGLLNN